MENIFIDLKRSFIEEGSKMFKVPYSIRTIQKMLKSLNFELKKKKKRERERRKRMGKGIFLSIQQRILHMTFLVRVQCTYSIFGKKIA